VPDFGTFKGVRYADPEKNLIPASKGIDRSLDFAIIAPPQNGPQGTGSGKRK